MALLCVNGLKECDGCMRCDEDEAQKQGEETADDEVTELF